MKRIGIGTADGVSVCGHLARSAAFLVVEVEHGRVTSRTTRTRSTDRCGNHATFVDMLAGCDAVLCGGIGQGAFDSLTAHGILPVVLAAPLPVEEALHRYLSGTLDTSQERVCLCH